MAATSPLSGKRVLIVEDDLLIAASLSYLMMDHGRLVEGPAFTAAQAIRIVDRQSLDGAFLDVELREGLGSFRSSQRWNLEEGRRWAESRTKTLTGGDKIAARFMRQDFFEYAPRFKLIVDGNHKPGLRSVDEAIRQRFNLVPFNVTIPADEGDPNLREKLKAEWSDLRCPSKRCIRFDEPKITGATGHVR